ncbi:MAG: hypothetical protein JO208_15360 [Alphaproteobacteria bacterium]|nr:hypothetical protein [Alphaproteobacteria bacterium]
MKSCVIGLFCAGVVLIQGLQAHAASFTKVSVAGSTGTGVSSINSNGDLTGSYGTSDGNGHGFIRTADGKIKTFDANGPLSNTSPAFINDAGAVSGGYIDADRLLGFFRSNKGAVTLFDAGGDQVILAGMNNSNVIAGRYFGDDGVRHGFIRAADGSITKFDDPNAAHGTIPRGINDLGDVVGQYTDAANVDHAFIRTADGNFSEFDVQGIGTCTGEGTYAFGINKIGAIVGWCVDSGGQAQGFLRSPKGKTTEFVAPDGVTTRPFAIDEFGNVSGYYFDQNGVAHSFVRSKAGKLIEFDPPKSLTSEAYAIAGQGVAVGPYTDSKGHNFGFIRTP